MVLDLGGLNENGEDKELNKKNYSYYMRKRIYLFHPLTIAGRCVSVTLMSHVDGGHLGLVRVEGIFC